MAKRRRGRAAVVTGAAVFLCRVWAVSNLAKVALREILYQALVVRVQVGVMDVEI